MQINMSIYGTIRPRKVSRAFALPTVLIASVVLLSILAVSVTATAAVRTTLKNQYYAQLAQVAGEAGVAMAKACLAKSGNVPEWTNAKPLTPATDCSGNLTLSPKVKTLIVAAGGSGGSTNGGGGGGGGVLYNDSVPIENGTTYAVTVAGTTAAAANGAIGNNGGNSSFNGLVAIGGGRGGYYYPSTNSSAIGAAGGSSGGSGAGGMVTGSGAGTSGQGYDGSATGMGGGGGAGGYGQEGNGTGGTGGDGGPGATYDITDTSGAKLTYGAGGGGGYGGSAGNGGSGNGSGATGGGAAGAANTGAGGGGGYASASGTGGAGGSGVVIISYPIASGTSATVSGAVTTATVGANKVHKFTGSGSFNVTSVGTSSCPTDPSCSVMINENVRSSFSVGLPTLDSGGRAVTIPNTGYVNIFRTSSNTVWRTYTQPSTQAAVVPDLCSGDATSARGWSAAVKSTTTDAFPVTPSAQTIAVATGPVIAGDMYFRKDFNVSRTGAYTLNVLSSSGQDIIDSYIDDRYISNATNGLATTTTTLTPGCHTLVIRVLNSTVVSRISDVTASLTLEGNPIPIVVTDTSWRVSDGDQVHFSETNYDEAPTIWEPAQVMGTWSTPTTLWGGAPTDWYTASGDSWTSWISTKYVVSGTNRPGSSYAWFRQTTPFTTTTATTVRLSNYCDDKCDIYLDGDLVMNPAITAGLLSQKDITIQPGTHTFGVRLYNTSAGPAGFLFTAVNKGDSSILARSDAGWDSTNYWTTTNTDAFSYDRTFVPTPTPTPSVNARVLVVGGGGNGGGGYQGGGGGAGQVLYNANYPLKVGNYTVVVGAGGAGGVGATNSGGFSLFDGLRAVGGAFGGGQTTSATVYTLAGANGAGTAHPVPSPRVGGLVLGSYPGGFGVTVSSTSGSGGGGGGAGGDGANGTTTAGGTGGVATAIPSVSGSPINYGGGGAGSFRGSASVVAGGSGIGGNSGTTGSAGAANTGSGGGAGNSASGTGVGGAGGSGVVIITYPTNAMTATGGTISYLAGYTIHKFTTIGTSTFTVTSVP